MKFPGSYFCRWNCPLFLVVVPLVLAGARAHAQGGEGRVVAAGRAGVEFHGVKSYGHGAEERPATGAGGGGGGEPASEFPISTTRFIEVRAVFENLLHGDRASDYEVTIGLYSFDNQLISARKKTMAVAADWKFAWVSQSYGWPEAGRWSVGTYRVKVWIGDEKVGEAAIYLRDDTRELPASVAGIEIGGVDFYEGGSFFRPGPADDAAVTFLRSKVRRIYWVARGGNRLHRVRAQRPNVVGYFYRPDGTLFGEAANRFLIAPEVEEAVLVEGLGWTAPGNWEPGSYRFELEQDHRVVAEEVFEITDPFLKPRVRPQVVHYGIIDAGAFAAGQARPPEVIGRAYETMFKRGETEYIWSELVVVNNPNHTLPHSHQVSWQYFQPDGALLGKAETEFVIQPEWKTARQTASFGWDQAGRWEVGAYKVRIVIDGRLARLLRFEVAE